MTMDMRDLLNKLEEALKPSQYRAVVKGWDKERYADIFKDPAYEHDKNGYRIFIPLDGQSTNSQPIKAPPDIEKVLTDNGFEIQDYSKGIVYNKNNKQSVKIGKVLNKLNRQDLMQKFNNDKRREGTKNSYMAVISRHPYDLAGMSTDRGWTSCMNLDCGAYRSYVPIDADKGTVIAYVTTVDDKNLNNPSGRVLIKPFYDRESNDDQVYFGIEDRVYGTNVPGFTDVVTKWVNMVNTKYNGLTGVAMVTLDPDLYADGSSTRMISGTGDYDVEAYLQKNPNRLDDIVQKMGFPEIYDVSNNTVILQRWNDLEDFANELGYETLRLFASKEYEMQQGKEGPDDAEIRASLEDYFPSAEDYEEVLRYLTERDMKKIGDDLRISGEVGSFTYLRDIAENMEDSKYWDAMRTAMVKASTAGVNPSPEDMKAFKDILINSVYHGLEEGQGELTIAETSDNSIQIIIDLDEFISGIGAAVSGDEDDYDAYYYKSRMNSYNGEWIPGFYENEAENYFKYELVDEDAELFKRMKPFLHSEKLDNLDNMPFDEQMAANIFSKEMLQIESIQRLKQLANIQ